MEQKSNNTIVEKIINKIETDHVTPIGKWRFVLKNNSFWALWGLSVLIGACAVAATIFVYLNADWQYYPLTHDTFFKFFFDIMPLFWLVSFGLMVLFGYYNIRHTSRGYRFSFYLVIIAGIIASFIGGTALYALGVAKDIDNIRRPLPFVNSIMMQEENRWNDIDRGLLSGVVTVFDSGKEQFTLRFVDGQEKFISTTELSDRDISLLTQGSHIRVIGDGGDDGEVFIACVILPWDKPRLNQPIPVERNINIMRINKCKDVRPYQKYKSLLNLTN